MNEPTILLISKDDTLTETIEGLATEIGHLRVMTVPGLDEAYAYDDWNRAALLLIHHHPGDSVHGVARLFRMLAAAKRPVATLILGDHLDEQAEADLIRRGAADCLGLPLDGERLGYLMEVLTLRVRQPGCVRPATHEGEPAIMWADTDPLVSQGRRVAGQDATILIRGEEGTGKSRLARIIHDVSPRSKGPFVTLRCAIITPEGFEADLADPELGEMPEPSSLSRRLAESREGTVVLDDVDALSPPAQIALLRWIEEGGRAASARGHAWARRPRIIATTRVDLADEVASGRFRSDLFFRLNVIGLELPPLRQRRSEIASIALKLSSELAGRSVNLTPEAVAAVESYSWPGNVRELRDALRSAVMAGGGGPVGQEHLPEVVTTAVGWAPPRRELAEAVDMASTLAQTKRDAEFVRITQALQKNGNNRLRTASELGISRMTLYKKLYKYGIIEPAGAGGRSSPERPRTPGHPGGTEGGADKSSRGASPTETAADDFGPDARTAAPGARARLGKSAPILH